MTNGNTKIIGGVEYRTHKLGALKQMRLTPAVLRWLSGPLGLIVELLNKNKSVVGGLVARFNEVREKRAAGDTFARVTPDEIKQMLSLDVDSAMITKVVASLAEDFERDGIDTVLDLLEGTFAIVEGKPLQLDESGIDAVFDGKLLQLVQVVAWVVSVNFADFSHSGTRAAAASGNSRRSNVRSPRGSKP